MLHVTRGGVTYTGTASVVFGIRSGLAGLHDQGGQECHLQLYLRMHDLRHTTVSLWIAHGASAKQVQVWAGDRSVTTMFDRYGHLLPRDDDQDNALDAMARDAREAVGGSACEISVGSSAPTVTPLRPPQQ